MDARAIPILPSRDLERTRAFYARLGFAVERAAGHDYLLARLGDLELHFAPEADLDPCRSYAMCFLRTPDVEALHERWSALGLPEIGIPRLTALEDGPWREFALVDEDGTLVRVGAPRA